MAGSDRTQYKQALLGTMGDSRSVSNAALLVAQDAQRYDSVQFTSAVAANTSANYSMARLDRPVVIKELRLLPSAAVTVNGNTTFVLCYTNDNGGSVQNIAIFNTNQNTSLGLGNLAQWVSVNCLAVASAVANGNASLFNSAALSVPAGSHLILKQIGTSPSESIPAGSEFQFIWEEV